MDKGEGYKNITKTLDNNEIHIQKVIQHIKQTQITWHTTNMIVLESIYIEYLHCMFIIPTVMAKRNWRTWWKKFIKKDWSICSKSLDNTISKCAFNILQRAKSLSKQDFMGHNVHSVTEMYTLLIQKDDTIKFCIAHKNEAKYKTEITQTRDHKHSIKVT